MEGGCLVLDMGSGSIKAEFAGAEVPKVFQNVTGHVKHSAVLPQQQLDGLVDGSIFASNDVAKHRGLLRLSYPMTNGHITDWNGITNVLNHVNGTLGADAANHPILMSEAALTSRPQRAKLGQILFEQIQHPSLVFCVQPIISLYSTGNTTGIVLDIGEGVTQACPVYKGYSVREATRRVDFGGRDVTQHLQMLLRQSGTFLDTSAEFDIVREIKESRCVVSPNALRAEALEGGAGSGNGSVTYVKHTLPDGTDVTIGAEQQLAPEVLFQPALMGRECPSVVQVLSEAIRRCDIDLRRHMYENVFLSGGTTMMPKFPNRFLGEATKRTPRDCKIRVMAPSERLYTSWIGGSFLAQLSTFKQMTIKKSEYAEEGERILHSRLFC